MAQNMIFHHTELYTAYFQNLLSPHCTKMHLSPFYVTMHLTGFAISSSTETAMQLKGKQTKTEKNEIDLRKKFMLQRMELGRVTSKFTKWFSIT